MTVTWPPCPLRDTDGRHDFGRVHRSTAHAGPLPSNDLRSAEFFDPHAQ